MKGLLTYGPKICSYIYWAKTKSGIPMKFDDLKDGGKMIERLCSMVVDSKLYAKQTASEYMTLLTANKFTFEYLLPRFIKE